MPKEVISLSDLDSLIGESDLPYEYQIIENSDDLNSWLRYYWHKDTVAGKLFILRRACSVLGRSYKLWNLYLDLRLEVIEGLNPVEYANEYTILNNEFEQALKLLNKFPLIWVKYLRFLSVQTNITLIRRKFNESLRILPITQHSKIWPLFLEFADSVGGLTGSKIYKRYLTFNASKIELVIEKLVEFKDIDGALELYERVLKDESFVTKDEKSPLSIWLDYVTLLCSKSRPNTKHDKLVWEVINNGLLKFPDQKGKLYVKLASYFINRQDFEKVREIFEEGLATVLTVKDFTLIYESYTQFEESLLSTLVKKAEENPNDIQLNNQLDYRLESFEKLMDRRTLLISDVKIRQNINNVEEWLERAKLYPEENLSDILQCYVKAITTIDPRKSSPGLSKIWIQYSRIYEDNNDVRTARTIFDKAVKVPYNSPDELINIWLEWAELELRQDDLDTAIKVLEVASKVPEQSHSVDFNDETLPVQARIHKSIKLWSFYLDLVESSGDISKTSEIYERVFELRIATPLTVINYANFLEENHRFEESFKIYERGISLFKYPIVFDIWNIYLTKAIKRNLKVERIRDLFEQALDSCPSDLSKAIFLLYSQYEEDKGSISKAIKVLEIATDKVDVNNKYEVFEILIQKIIDNLGLSTTRPVFAKALDILPLKDAVQISIKFAQVELQLKEYERVRGILKHGGLLQSPSKSSNLWDFWHEFEVEYGSKETYKEMLRIKRQANDEFDIIIDSEKLGFVKSTDGPKISNLPVTTAQEENPDAIDLDI